MHIRLFFCLGCSLLAHYLIIKNLVFAFDIQAPAAYIQPLRVTLTENLTAPVNNPPSWSVALSQYLSQPSFGEMVETLPKLDFVATKVIQNQAEEQVDSQTKTSLADKIPDTSNYYASNEVERKALPQLNIDMSSIDTSGYSGLPIKLRLYINAYGRLVKIDRIAVLDQDKAYVSALEKLLFDLVYMPAKKDSLDVDAYQDVVLSFNPLPLPTQPAELNPSIN